jgi:plasminogen activator
LLVLAQLAFLASASGALAQMIDPKMSTSTTGVGWSADASIGVLYGKGQEFVYNPDGSTVSRLDWRMNHDAMFSGGLAVRPLNWLTLGFRGSTNLTSGATNDDYDFNLFFCPPSGGGSTECHSNSPSLLRNAESADVYVEGEIFNRPNLQIGILGGYMYDFYNWQAYGGTYNYGPSSPGLDALPPGLGISYEQTWKTPYIGLSAAGRAGQWSWNGRVIGSWWVDGSDLDQHQAGGLDQTTIYHDSFGRSSMIEGDIGLGYLISRGVSITGNYAYKNWETAKGSTLQETATTSNFFPGNAAGANNVSHLLRVGLDVDVTQAGYGEGLLGLVGNAHGSAPRWTGAYIGADAGWAWDQAKWDTTGLAFPPFGPLPVGSSTNPQNFDANGPSAAAFGGYNYQMGQVVLGFEGDVGHRNLSHFRTGIPGTDPYLFPIFITPVPAPRGANAGGGFRCNVRIQ